MTFLPIVQRELRVASRRPSTFRFRFWGAVAAAGLGGAWLLASAAFGTRWVADGLVLFRVLVGIDFGLALLAGALLTADTLSRERREGTLGLLFLTDLGGFDVVAGKFAALALVPLHMLLASIPVLTLTVFLGGVVGSEVARAGLVLLHTLGLSMATGLWISSLVLDDRKAVGLTLGALGLWTVGPDLLARVLSVMPGGAAWDWVGLASPSGLLAQAFEHRYRTAGGGFWWGLGAQSLLVWVLVGMAAVMVRRLGRGGGSQDVVAADGRVEERAGISGKVRRARRRRLLGEGPMAWQGWPNRWVERGAWGVVGFAGVVAATTFGVQMASGERYEAGREAGRVIFWGFVVLKLLLAVHAVHALQESCRSGAMELLLITPVSSRRLWDGHLAAMRAVFTWPFLVLAFLHVAVGVAGKVVMGGDWPSRSAMVLSGAALPVVDAVIHAFDLVAVAYHASRWALHYDRPMKALMRTAGMAVVLPAVFCGYGRILVDLLIIGQARPRLERFREAVRAWYFPGVLGVGYGAPRAL